MDKDREKKIDRLVFGTVIAALVLVVAVILYSALVLKKITILYFISIIAFLVIFWVMMDVVSPLLKHTLDGKTKEQLSNYYIYAALNLVSLCGLGYFAFAVGNNTSIYGALVYMVAMFGKRRFLDEFNGVTHDEDDEPDENDENTEEITEENLQASDKEAVPELVQTEEISEKASEESSEEKSEEA